MTSPTGQAHESAIVRSNCLCREFDHAIVLAETDLPLKAYMCHCDSCRHMTGTLCWSVAFLPETFNPNTLPLEKLRSFQYSKRILLYFCPTCGCHIVCRVQADADDPNSAVTWAVSTGTLNQTDGVIDVKAHEHIQDTLDGGVADFVATVSEKRIARWAGTLNAGDELSIPWTAARPKIAESPHQSRLHAYCKCGNINFWVSRPSSESAKCSETWWPDQLRPTGSAGHSAPVNEAWWLRDSKTRYLAGLCACDSCRLATGSEWMPWAFVPEGNLSLDAAGEIPLRLDHAMLTEYRSSPGVRRYFCRGCGAAAFYDSDVRDRVRDVAVGLLSAIEGSRAETWLEWSTDRLGFQDDAVGRADSLLCSIQEGLRDYGTRQASGKAT